PDRDHRREQVDGKEQLEKTIRESQSPAQRHHGEREQERVEQERVAAVAVRMPQAAGTADHPGAKCTYHGTLLRSRHAFRDFGWCPTCGDMRDRLRPQLVELTIFALTLRGPSGGVATNLRWVSAIRA